MDNGSHEVPASGRSSDDRLLICARLNFERRLIGMHLGFRLCSNPVWDMMLELYDARAHCDPVPVSALGAAAHVPLSSAIRCMSRMEQASLIARSHDPDDGRRILVELAPPGIIKLDRIFDALGQVRRADHF